MSLSMEESFELPGIFIRGSKCRKSFRVRHRNAKLPPAAILYINSLEKSNVNDINTSQVVIHPKCDKKNSISKKDAKVLSKLTEIIETEETNCDDTVPLLRRTSSRKSFKKPSAKKYKKLNKLISFFR